MSYGIAIQKNLNEREGERIRLNKRCLVSVDNGRSTTRASKSRSLNRSIVSCGIARCVSLNPHHRHRIRRGVACGCSQCRRSRFLGCRGYIFGDDEVGMCRNGEDTKAAIFPDWETTSTSYSPGEAFAFRVKDKIGGYGVLLRLSCTSRGQMLLSTVLKWS
jgi:hypothetical protein